MNVINVYDKSSCPTQNCEGNFNNPPIIKSSLSVSDYVYPSYFNCYNTYQFNQNIQPDETKKGIVELNPQYYSSKLQPMFDQIDCCGPCQTGDKPWISTDPRLYDPIRADYLLLDRPPISGQVKMKDIYNLNPSQHYTTGQGKSYETTFDGQIGYYIDKSIEDPYFSPVFNQQSNVTSYVYKDPMGAMKPHYDRVPVVAYNPVTITRACVPEKLTFLADTGSFREDIIASQQAKNNQSKYSSRWQ